MLITKTVRIKWNASNKKHYEKLGYIYTKMGDEFEVKVEDLTKGTDIKIKYECDCCKNIFETQYRCYLKYLKEGKKYCNDCAVKLYGIKNGRKIRDKNSRKIKLKESKSFYDWCVENNRQDVLDRWDYELNDCSLKEVSYNTNKKMWLKCNKHLEHNSELKSIKDFTGGCEGTIKCSQCNSIAQYILDNFPNKKLEEVWDYEKNKDLDPWKISKNSTKKVWILCQEVDYHGSYLITPHKLNFNGRCPYCTRHSGKVHPLDSLGQYIIDNYGEEFLWKVWSDKNNMSPFDLSPYSRKEIIWNCFDNKHKPFKRSCRESTCCEFRCPECVSEREESIIEEKTRLYLEELGYEVKTEHNCTIRPINPKTKQPLPFDNEIILENGKHLIIEVHGSQHYKSDFFMTRKKITKEEAEKELHYQQVKDRYKRIKCIQAGYEYLEIPYTAFDEKETYKKLIDERIEEIRTKLIKG